MTGDILNRVELRTPDQARAVLKSHTLPWVGEQLKAGRELVAEFRLLDDDITERQRGFLHGVVLIEVKDGSQPPSKRQLTDDQIQWHVDWRGGACVVVSSVGEALAAIGVRS